MSSIEPNDTAIDPPASPVTAGQSSSSTAEAPSPSGAPPTTVEPDLGRYKVWNPPKSLAATPASIPESYFEPTAGELKLAYMTQTRLVDQLSNAPLKTQAIRERETKAKLQRWPETTLRIKFPSQLMLERRFSSSDTIKAVYAFVRGALADEAKPNKFVLFDTPPRRELKVSDPAVKTQTLTDLNLSPSSILHFSFLDESLNDFHAPPPLLSSILANAVDLPPPPTFDEPAQKSAKGKGKIVGGTGGSDEASLGDKKLPKWLKLGKK